MPPKQAPQPLTQEKRTELQTYRQSLREKTVEELQQLVNDAGLMDQVINPPEGRKPPYIRALAQKKREELRNA